MTNVAQPLVQTSLLGEAIDRGPALVFVADEDMRLLAVNDAACVALGYGREELVGMMVTDIARYPAASEEYARVVATGAGSGRAELVRVDGETFAIEYRASRTVVAQMALYVSIGFPVE